MSSRLIAAAIFAAGLAVIVFYYFGTRPTPPAEIGEDATAAGAPGPYMVLTVAGEAEGEVVIDLNEEAAPQHAERLEALTREGAYDGVVFHRVIDGFMAQTGDVENGRADGDLMRAGTGGSDLPDLPAEFSSLPFERGVVGMARSRDPDSANSQFFIMFDRAEHLDGQYTVVGAVTEGMEVVDAIRRGAGGSGTVSGTPDRIVEARMRAAP